MKKVTGAQARPTLLALIYGQSKTRKTTTGLFVPPEMRPCAFFDVDRGAFMRLQLLTMSKEERDALGVVEQIPEEAGPWMREGIDFFYPEEGSLFGDAMEFCTTVAMDYKTIIIDSLSAMAAGFLDEVKSAPFAGTDKQTKRVKVVVGGRETVHAIPADYGFAQDRVMEIISAADRSPAHVLMISHEKTGEIKENDVTSRVIAGPRTVGNALLEMVPAVTDVVLRFETKRKAGGPPMTVVRSTNHNIYLAGDRSGLFKDGEELNPVAFWERTMKLIGMGQSKETEA